MHVYSLPITILDAPKPTQAPVINLFLSDKRLYLVLIVSLIGSIFSFTEPQSLLHDEEEEIVDLLRKRMEMGDAEAIYSI